MKKKAIKAKLIKTEEKLEKARSKLRKAKLLIEASKNAKPATRKTSPGARASAEMGPATPKPAAKKPAPKKPVVRGVSRKRSVNERPSEPTPFDDIIPALEPDEVRPADTQNEPEPR